MFFERGNAPQDSLNFLVFRLAPRYPSAVPMRIGIQSGLTVLCAGLAFSLAGCGAGTSARSISPVQSPLSGNWLLVGSLPFIGPGQVGSQNFGIATTFSVLEDQIVGGGTFQVPCGQSTAGFSSVIGGTTPLSGNVAKDGSFTVQNPSNQPQVSTLQVQGVIPSGNGSSWTGSYIFSSNNSGCPFNSAVAFTAVRIADLTGTYAGSASLSPQTPPGGSSSQGTQPVSFTFTFQQGQTTPGTQTVNESVVNGGVQVQGTSCFNGGQIEAQALPQGTLLGTSLFATFTMDDGSNLHLSAHIEDVASSKLGVVSLSVIGGKCDGQFTGSFDASRQ